MRIWTFARAIPAIPVGVVFGAASVGAFACGPSFQAVHDGEARFEHCYALDERPNEPLEKKAECWNDWAKHYTYGQTRDRVQYAVARARALGQVPNLPTDEAMMSAAPGEGVRNAAVAPAPTSAFAPPPKTMEAVDAGGADGGAANGRDGRDGRDGHDGRDGRDGHDGAGNEPAVPKPAALSCADDCESTWINCRTQCRTKKCDECERTYKGCLRKCTSK